MEIFKIFLFIAIYFILKTETKEECSFDTALIDNQQVVLTDFTSFDQLKFNCKKPINMSILTLHPIEKIILDSSLKFNKTKIISSQDFFSIELRSFNGFDLSTNPFHDLNLTNYDSRFIYWNIEDSMLNFQYKNISFSNNCNSKLMENYGWSNSFFNGYITLIDISTKYTTNVCPLVFRNSFIKTLLFQGISSSLINKNELGFLSPTEMDPFTLSSYVYHLGLGLYRTNLDKKILNKDTFAFTVVIEINGIINSIQTALFKDFKNLKVLFIKMNYVQNIFKKNNKWLQYLNYNEIIDSTKPFEYSQAFFLVLYQTLFRKEYYKFPNEDFCYFKNFPHNRHVMPLFEPNLISSCTCTHLFLVQNSHLLRNEFSYDSNVEWTYQRPVYYAELKFNGFLKECSIDNNIEEEIKKCDFKKRLFLCNIIDESLSIENDNKTSRFYFAIEDWEILSNLSHYYIFILNQIVSLICLFSNLIFILVISNKNLSKEFQKTYKYLKIYTILNCINIIILFAKFVCFKDMFFCHITKDFIYIYYFKLISVRLLSNILNTASNITYVSFTLSRYIAITNIKLKIFIFFEKISFKLYFLILSIFSVFINIYIFFVSPNKTESSSSSYTQGKRVDKLSNLLSQYNFEEIGDYKANFDDSSAHLFNALQIIRIILSDLLYIILVFIIDLALLKFITIQMRKKEAITELVDIQMTQLKRLKLKRQKKNSKKRLSSLIIINGINFLLFKLPSSLVNLYSFIYYFDQTNNIYKPNIFNYTICRYFNFCESVAELAHFFYLLSYLIQFFIFYKLDKNFHQHFLALVFKVKKKIRPTRAPHLQVTRL
jgi:hypothetical protein